MMTLSTLLVVLTKLPTSIVPLRRSLLLLLECSTGPLEVLLVATK